MLSTQQIQRHQKLFWYSVFFVPISTEPKEKLCNNAHYVHCSSFMSIFIVDIIFIFQFCRCPFNFSPFVIFVMALCGIVCAWQSHDRHAEQWRISDLWEIMLIIYLKHFFQRMQTSKFHILLCYVLSTYIFFLSGLCGWRILFSFFLPHFFFFLLISPLFACWTYLAGVRYFVCIFTRDAFTIYRFCSLNFASCVFCFSEFSWKKKKKKQIFLR